MIDDVIRKVIREELARYQCQQEPFCTMAEAGKLMRCNVRTAQTSLQRLGVPLIKVGRKPLVARADVLRIAGLG